MAAVKAGREPRLERERELIALAGRQHGVVARHQLSALGLGNEAIKKRLRSGRLLAVHRGVYAIGHGQLNLRGHWLAAVLACGEGAVLSHRSAAALWGLMRSKPSSVEVTSSRGRPGRFGIRLHRARIDGGERTVRVQIPVTSLPRTLLDLAGVVDERRLTRAFEEADRLGILRIPALEQICARGGNRKGLPTLRRLVAAARTPTTTRSPLEDRFAEFYREHLADLPAPLTNVSILGNEVDAYWPRQRLVIEMDSWEFHHHRAAFERDRARDAALQADGYRVIRLTHRQLEQESPRIATQLRALLGVEQR